VSRPLDEGLYELIVTEAIAAALAEIVSPSCAEPYGEPLP
jgi:hypothetical protein